MMLSLPISGDPPSTIYVSSASRASRSWISQSRQQANMVLWISKKQRLLAFVNANTSPGKGSFDDPIIMVDPVEAKRLAAKQMQEIKVKEKLKKRRHAEAINGTLAMIGLTAGLVIEGQTGKGILGQLAGYLEAFVSLFIR